jgi:hypothetical protein
MDMNHSRLPSASLIAFGGTLLCAVIALTAIIDTQVQQLAAGYDTTVAPQEAALVQSTRVNSCPAREDIAYCLGKAYATSRQIPVADFMSIFLAGRLSAPSKNVQCPATAQAFEHCYTESTFKMYDTLLTMSAGLPTSTPISSSLFAAALQKAKIKEQDAEIKATLSNMRAQAELYYDANNSSYAGLCTTPGSVHTSLQKYGKQATCSATPSEYVIATPLLSDPKNYFCVDSTGNARVLTGAISTTIKAGTYKCPM